MDIPFKSRDIVYDASHPIVEGAYIPHEGQPRNSLLFCEKCQTTFYDGPMDSKNDILAYTAAEQIAFGHAIELQHTVCSAKPEMRM